jgi:dTDP-4-amino-4,6-dideoxygalactose transaminase
MPISQADRHDTQTLALLGGLPAFVEPVHVGRPNVGDRQRFFELVNELLDRRWFTNDGPLVRQLEQRVADLVGVKHCVAMCNATVALEIAIRALGLRGEVIVPSYTFVATAHALQWQEITPVFADMDPATHNIDPDAIARLVTPRTSGIIGVHVWGRACETERLELLAAKYNLALMYDAAHGLGCSHNGRMLGSFGKCEVFSFHATKFVNTFEGGAVVTNDDALANTIRLMRNFGFAGYDRVDYLGTNGKMPEICAAMGLASMDAMPRIVDGNQRNYAAYRVGLQDVPGVSVVEYPSHEMNNYHYIVVEVDDTIAALTRDQLVAVLHAENVLARKYFWPGCHRMEPYRSLQPNAHLLLPHTERVGARIMVLPNGEAVDGNSVATICGVISSAMKHATEIKGVLETARPRI